MKSRLVKRKKSLWARFWEWVKRKRWEYEGWALERRLRESGSAEQNDAALAVKRVVMETNIPPDCVSAIVRDGGCCILVKHDDAWEGFIHNSYSLAADKAIEWLLLQGDEIEASKTSKMNRAQRRAFDHYRKSNKGKNLLN